MYGGWVIAVSFGLFEIYSNRNRQLRRDNDETAKNLIDNLTKTVELQKEQLEQMQSAEIERGKQIASLQGQVQTLSEILQGRDPKMQTFLQQVPELCEIVGQNREIALNNGKAVKDLTEAITSLVVQITPQPTKTQT